MIDKIKGIAVILFGILLSSCGEELNRTIFANLDDFPRVTLLGIILGIVGLVMVFKRDKEQ